jgi:hypothetical protein
MDQANPDQPGEPAPPDGRPSQPGRLERPPGERYATPAVEADGQEAAEPSAGRAVSFGVIGTVIGAVLLVLFGGVLAFHPGLVVVAFFLGRIVGLLVRVGAGNTMSPAARNSLAIVLSLLGIAAAQLGIWVYALYEGGTLPLIEYLLQTYGGLVPLQAMVATGAAWWSSR